MASAVGGPDRLFPRLDGSWERADRNPALGTAILVVILGSVYFLAGNILSVVAVLSKMLSGGLAAFAPGAGRPADQGIFEYMKGFYAQNRVWILGITALCQFGIFGLAGFLCAKRWFSRDVLSYSGYGRPSPFWIGAGALGAILILPVVDIASYLTNKAFPGLDRLGEISATLLRWSNPAEAALVFFCISLTPAICEEFMFRGILQRGLQRRLPFPWSIILSGTIFAFYHQSALSLPALVPVGIFLGLLYWASGSIWPGMAFHALYNGGIILLTNAQDSFPGFLFSGDYFSPLTWLAACLCMIALSWLLVARGLRSRGPQARDDGAAAAA